MNQGLLVPGELTINIILDKVLTLSTEEGFILDGFPRTTEQAEALEKALDEGSRQLDKMVFINVPRVNPKRANVPTERLHLHTAAD